jgi:hypothetical protein
MEVLLEVTSGSMERAGAFSKEILHKFTLPSTSKQACEQLINTLQRMTRGQVAIAWSDPSLCEIVFTVGSTVLESSFMRNVETAVRVATSS